MATTQCFKQKVLDFKMKIFSEEAMPSPRAIGVYLLTKVIPSMDERKEDSFAWHFAGKDVCLYTKAEYDAEINNYINTHKMKCSKGNVVWHYDYTLAGGKKRRCVMTTEIWFKPDADHSISPIALLCGQFMGNGLHITRCVFQDA